MAHREAGEGAAKVEVPGAISKVVSRWGVTGKRREVDLQAGGTRTMPEVFSDKHNQYADMEERGYWLRVRVTHRSDGDVVAMMARLQQSQEDLEADDFDLIAVKRDVVHRLPRVVDEVALDTNLVGDVPLAHPAVDVAPVHPAVDADGAMEDGANAFGQRAVPAGLFVMNPAAVDAHTDFMRVLMDRVRRSIAEGGRPRPGEIAHGDLPIAGSESVEERAVRQALESGEGIRQFKAEFNRIATSIGGKAISADLYSELNIHIGFDKFVGSILAPSVSDEDLARKIMLLVEGEPELRPLIITTLSILLKNERPVLAKELITRLQTDPTIPIDSQAQWYNYLAHLDSLILSQSIQAQSSQLAEMLTLLKEQRAALPELIKTEVSKAVAHERSALKHAAVEPYFEYKRAATRFKREHSGVEVHDAVEEEGAADERPSHSGTLESAMDTSDAVLPTILAGHALGASAHMRVAAIDTEDQVEMDSALAAVDGLYGNRLTESATTNLTSLATRGLASTALLRTNSSINM